MYLIRRHLTTTVQTKFSVAHKSEIANFERKVRSILAVVAEFSINRNFGMIVHAAANAFEKVEVYHSHENNNFVQFAIASSNLSFIRFVVVPRQISSFSQENSLVLWILFTVQFEGNGL